jgi:hypothetical protein
MRLAPRFQLERLLEKIRLKYDNLRIIETNKDFLLTTANNIDILCAILLNFAGAETVQLNDRERK